MRNMINRANTIAEKAMSLNTEKKPKWVMQQKTDPKNTGMANSMATRVNNPIAIKIPPTR